MPNEEQWLIVGDFNLIRRPEDRNMPGGDINEIFLFNEAISNLGLIEIPLLGRKFTWTNKQHPLCLRLDWFFTSASQTLTYPTILAKSMIMETSDHWPCIVEISTNIPKAKIFRFENYQMQHESLKPIIWQAWSIQTNLQDPTKIITAKFKNLRRILKTQKANVSSLGQMIQNVKATIYLLESIELIRDLSLSERNFRDLLCEKLVFLLKMQRTFLKQRGKIRWIKEGDVGTRFFHVHATISNRTNTISTLSTKNSSILSSHDQKAKLIWQSLKTVRCSLIQKNC